MIRRSSIIFLVIFNATQTLSAATLKENIKDIAHTAGQQIKGAGTYMTKLPDKIRSKVDHIVNNYWGATAKRSKVAQVRAGISLSPGEKNAIAQRTDHVATAIEKTFKKTNYTPKIAVLCSGGGYRAMATTIGFLAGAQKEGLLDMVTWIAGVSGGTWGMASVFTKAQLQGGKLDIAAFGQEQARLLANSSLKPTDKNEYKAIGNILLVQSVGHQLFTVVNFYGALIANRIFGFLKPDARQRALLSQQASLVKDGSWPIPIYTVVQYDIGLPAADYRWVEFNPWEYGGTWLHSYAPIWATSRTFHDGVSTNFHPERSLGFILGMCGTAFAVDFNQIYDAIKDGLYPFVRTVIEQSLLARYALNRVSWAQLSNYTRGLSISPIKDEIYLNLIDAAFTANIPYQPLSGQRPERKPDMLIIVDSSADPLQALKAIEQYAKKYKLKFPVIDYRGIDKRFVSVFYDPEDREVPVIVYLWRTTDYLLHEQLDEQSFKEYRQWIEGFDMTRCIEQGECSFTNMSYSAETMTRIIKTMEFQTRVVMPTIFDAVRQLINRKSEGWLNRLKWWK